MTRKEHEQIVRMTIRHWRERYLRLEEKYEKLKAMKTEPPELAEFRKLYGMAPLANWARCLSIERTPGKVSGAWVFKGTRVPVYALFENLDGGATLDRFVEHFPGVTRKHVDDLLEFLLRRLEQGAAGKSSCQEGQLPIKASFQKGQISVKENRGDPRNGRPGSRLV